MTGDESWNLIPNITGYRAGDGAGGGMVCGGSRRHEDEAKENQN